MPSRAPAPPSPHSFSPPCCGQAVEYLKLTNSISANDPLPDNLAALVPATAEQFAYMQWADCSILNTASSLGSTLS